MAWTEVKWACGHEGEMQLYGKSTKRDATVAFESGRKCMVCWLINQWRQENDPRSKRDDRYELAASIAKGKGKRIDITDDIPVEDNPLEKYSTEDLLKEIERRG